MTISLVASAQKVLMSAEKRRMRIAKLYPSRAGKKRDFQDSGLSIIKIRQIWSLLELSKFWEDFATADFFSLLTLSEEHKT